MLVGAVIDAPPHRMGLGGRTIGLRLRLGGRLIEAVGFGLGALAAELRRGMSIDAVVEFRPSQESRYHRPELRLLDFRVLPQAVDREPAASLATSA